MNIDSEKLHKAIEIGRKEGAGAFFNSSYKFVKKVLEDALRHGLRSMSLEIDGTKAVFDSTYGSRYRKVKWRFKTEYEILEDLIDELKSDDIFLDVGAGLGLHTCLPAKKPAGKVLAVEPFPPRLEQLRRNIELNDLDNVRILGLALSDSEGDSNFNGQTISLNSHETNLTVDTAMGDRLISRGEIPQPNVVKIDVEGSEPLVIEGLKEGLSDQACRLVYCEVHLDNPSRPSITDFGMNLSELKELLENCGFTLSTIRHRGDEIFIKGRK